MPELTIETMAVDELVPYAGNAKLHPPEQVGQIAASIEEFGNCDPIAVWTNADGEPEIVEGHGRVMALRKLGIAAAPVIRLDHLTDEQRRAYVHVHNQTTLSSTFDFDALAVDIADLPGFDWGTFDLAGLCEFNPIDDLMGDSFKNDTSGIDRDTFNITLSFPLEAKDSVSRYVACRGKNEIVAQIVDEAASWA